MVFGYVFWAVAALVSQVQSQQCNSLNVGIPVPVTAPILPAIQSPITLYPQSVIAPAPVISTTIIDNSVANSLANALQLLIVSELIGNSINAPIYASPYLPPLLDTVKSIGTVDIVTPAVDIAYAPVDITPVNYGAIVGVSPNVVTEVIAPTITNVVPPVYEGVTEIVQGPIAIPEVISPGIIAPNVYAPVTEVIAPNSAITEVIAPVTSTVTTNIYEEITEVNPLLVPEYVPVAPAPSIDMYTSITEVVNPIVPVAPTISLNPYYGLTEIPPYTTGYVTEAMPPYYGGYTELLTPIQFSGIPFAAEVIFPQSIPAQLKCNFGYSPSSVPLVNVETVPLVEPKPCYY